MPVTYPATWAGLRPSMRRRIDVTLDTLRGEAALGLHLGAGGVKIPGLLNCDLYDEAADAKVDCMDLSQFSDGAVDLIETHHMLEHLEFAEVDRARGEWHRALRPGGSLVLTCPNITRVAAKWLMAAIWPFGGAARREKRAYLLKMLYGPQSGGGMVHKSGYDAEFLRDKLAEFGFDVEFSHTPYPHRPTPSLLVVARKR